MIVFWVTAVILAIFQQVIGGPLPQDERTLRFSDRRREPEDLEYRTRRPLNGGGGSNIENIFKIPIAVIKGTSAAAQAFYPQNTETINKIFDIPVMTLDAVGNYIKERPQRPGLNVQDDTVEQAPIRFGNQRPDRRRDERRERLMQLREQERLERERRRMMDEDRLERNRRRLMEQERLEYDRRQSMEQERFFLGGGHHSIGLYDIASAFTDLLVGGGHGGGGLFGGHGHHHGHGQLIGKPPKRPLKPIKPSKPHKPHKPGHLGGIHGSLLGGNGGNNGYEVHEQFEDTPFQSSGGTGVFSWLQTTFQSDPLIGHPKIQNKIAPGSEFQNDHDIAEFRAL